MGLNMDYVWRSRRQKLAIELEELGCVPVEGGLFSDWLWRCKWCGLTVYVLVPRPWPKPRGVNEPTPIHYFLLESEAPSCWQHRIPGEKIIQGKRAFGLCVYIPPDFEPRALRERFRRRLCEVCRICC